ncbi:MAG: hypothetical protein AAF623_18495, partial [Planctomycetota bacterium]
MECPSCQEMIVIPKEEEPNDRVEKEIALFDDIFEQAESQAKAETAPSSLKSDNETKQNSDLHDQIEPGETGDLTATNSQDQQVPADPSSETGIEADEDNLIRVDGLEDLYGDDAVYGIECRVCETRIHVRPSQVGDYVKCPVCFTKVLVTDPHGKADASPKSGFKKVSLSDDDEIKLAPLADDDLTLAPPVDLPDYHHLSEFQPKETKPKPDKELPEPLPPLELIDEPANQPEPKVLDVNHDYDLHVIAEEVPGIELEPEEIPLENPKHKNENPDPPGSGEIAGTTLSRSAKLRRETKRKDGPKDRRPPRKRSRSRREKYEEAKKRAEPHSQDRAFEFELGDTQKTISNYPVFRMDGIAGIGFEALKMIADPNVLGRAFLATVFLSIGTVATYVYSGEPIVAEGEDVNFWQDLTRWFKQGFFGGTPYLVGLLILWHTASYLFREAARGQRRVSEWFRGGWNSIVSTFAIFSFSYFLCGLIVLP